MPKPADFFIGLIDFFAVLLPGAALGYLLLLVPWAEGFRAAVMQPLADPPAQWAAFLVLAYLLGHLLHHLGGFLDKPVYDRFLRTWRRVDPGWMVSCAAWEKFLAADGDGPKTPMEQRATELVAAHLKAFAGRVGKTDLGYDADRDKLFGWVDAAVRRADPALGEALDRAGVDSKFFRSMASVGLAAAVVAPWKLALAPDLEHRLVWCTGAVVVALAFVLFSLYRFGDRRWAVTELAYRHYVQLALSGEPLLPPAPPAPTPEPPGAEGNPFVVRVEHRGRVKVPHD